MDKKFYGLILPNKSQKYQPKLKSIFDSDEDEGESSIASKKKTVSEFSSSKLSTKNKLLQKKLAEEDPTIYEYDSVYDSLKQNQIQKQTSSKKEGTKYISSLLKAAEKRKKEQERRQEKKIQTERDKEGDEFKDKEAFVTSAYKQKMLEMQAEEEREKLLDQMDDMMDVTKQKDLSGFYRHYLKQTVGEEAVPVFGAKDEKVKELTEKIQERYSSSLQTVTKEDVKPHSSQNYSDLDADSYGSSEDDVKDDGNPKSPVNKSRSSDDHDHKLQKRSSAVKEQLHSKYKRKSTDNKLNYSTSSNDEKSHKTTYSESNIDKDLSDSSPEEETRDKNDLQLKESKSGKRVLHSECTEKSHSSSKRKCANSDSPPTPKLSSLSGFNSPNNDEKSHRKHKTHSTNIDEDLSNSSEEEIVNKSDVRPKKSKSEKVFHSKSVGKSHSSRKRKHDVDLPIIHDKTSNGDSELSDHENSHHNVVPENSVKTNTKPDITVKFAIRTVGEVFDQAQARYFKRMATRKIG